MKKIFITISVAFFLAACNSSEEKSTESTETTTTEETPKGNPDYDPNRGIGKFSTVDLGDKLDKKMAKAGQAIYDVKCSSCHKLTEERLVGPGWKGVTARNTPPWIMNFITNPDEMIDMDPKAQAQLEICLVRMPNQNLADDEARQLLEFMRENDGVK
jgi:hypothetical protein